MSEENTNPGCKQCRHFRHYVPLHQLLVRELRADDSPSLLQELNQLIGKAAERRAIETEARVNVIEQGGMTWELKPAMSDCCGEREDEGVFFLHEVRNAERSCESFEYRADAKLRSCSSCEHHRPGVRWDENNRELAQLMKQADDEVGAQQSRAREIMNRRLAVFEHQKTAEAHQCFYGQSFRDHPPQYLAHCAYYSMGSDFVPCIRRNAHGLCKHHEERRDWQSRRSIL